MSSSVGLSYPVFSVEANLLSVRELRSVSKYGLTARVSIHTPLFERGVPSQSAACLLTTPARPQLRLSGRLLAKNLACAHMGSHMIHTAQAQKCCFMALCCLCRVHRLLLPTPRHRPWTGLRLLCAHPALTLHAGSPSSTGMLLLSRPPSLPGSSP